MYRPSSMTRSRRICALVLVLGGVGLAASGSLGSSGEPLPVVRPSLALRLYRYQNTPAWAEAIRLRREGDRHDARLLSRITREPIATWFTRSSLSPEREMRSLTERAAAVDRAPVIVSYDVPGQGCALGTDDRGAPTKALYLSWVSALARGIGRHTAIVILEPDALAFALQGCPIAIATLRDAVEILSRAPRALVYIDAGNPSWIAPVERLAAGLESAGISRARGFALNVSNFQGTAADIAYGEKLVRLLGPTHFVIDTSRNGRGADTNPADAPSWCNPPGRALGIPPSTSTGVADLDAYLWVKPPGASDGSCRPGEPPAGRWWRAYALELAADAGRRLAPSSTANPQAH